MEQLQKHFDAKRRNFFRLYPQETRNPAILHGFTSNEKREVEEMRRKIYNEWLQRHSPIIQKLITETQGTYDIEKIKTFLKIYNDAKYDNKTVGELRDLFASIRTEILNSTDLPEMIRRLKEFTKIKSMIIEKRPQDKDFTDKISKEVYKKVGRIFTHNWAAYENN